MCAFGITAGPGPRKIKGPSKPKVPTPSATEYVRHIGFFLDLCETLMVMPTIAPSERGAREVKSRLYWTTHAYVDDVRSIDLSYARVILSGCAIVCRKRQVPVDQWLVVVQLMRPSRSHSMMVRFMYTPCSHHHYLSDL